MTRVTIGDGAHVAPGAVVGHEYAEDAGATVIGDDATIRAGSIVYADVEIGDGFITGHNVLVREETNIGDDVVVGTNTVIDGDTTVGSGVSLQTNVYIPRASEIGDSVFVGPCAVFTNDAYPVRVEENLEGPTLEDDVSVGANVTVLPDVTVGECSFVAAGAVVTRDVPPETLAVGAPAEHRPLPEMLTGGNQLA